MAATKVSWLPKRCSSMPASYSRSLNRSYIARGLTAAAALPNLPRDSVTSPSCDFSAQDLGVIIVGCVAQARLEGRSRSLAAFFRSRHFDVPSGLRKRLRTSLMGEGKPRPTALTSERVVVAVADSAATAASYVCSSRVARSTAWTANRARDPTCAASLGACADSWTNAARSRITSILPAGPGRRDPQNG
jgi:hypothetical protein